MTMIAKAKIEKNNPKFVIILIGQVEDEKNVSLNNLTFFLNVHLLFVFIPFTLTYG